jgi:integrase
MGTLSERKIREARSAAKDQWLNDGDGLYLRVRSSGSKVFIYRRKRDYKTSIDTLGPWPDMTLERARELVRQRRRQLVDPSAHTLRQAIDRFLEDVVRSHKRPDTYARYLERDLARLHTMKLRDLRRSHLSDIITKKTEDGPVAANRLLQVTKQLFAYVAEIGWLDSSPVEPLTRRVAGGAEQARSRHLTDDEIRRLWTVGGSNAHGVLMRWLLLTGQRISEAQSARWADFRDGQWHIPENKSGRPHWIPISAGMQAVLDAIPRRGQFVFGLTSSTATQAWLRRWCEREQIEPAFTPHDLRRTFATRLNGIGVAPHVVEKLLNHAMQGTMAVYNRSEYGPERIEALERWSTELQHILESGEAERVTALPA